MHSRKQSTPHGKLRFWIPACAGMLTILIYGNAYAADFTYAPKGCEFQMNFPEEPAPGQVCADGNPKDCHPVSVFTKIYDIDTGLRITITCTPAQPGMMEKYSGDVMQYTLGSMAKDHIDKDTAQSGFHDFGAAKQAVLMGSKKQTDGSETVYMSQIWIGKISVLTAEGEITGAQLPEADTLFAHIMKSVKPDSPDKTVEKFPDKDIKNTQKPAELQEKPVLKP